MLSLFFRENPFFFYGSIRAQGKKCTISYKNQYNPNVLRGSGMLQTKCRPTVFNDRKKHKRLKRFKHFFLMSTIIFSIFFSFAYSNSVVVALENALNITLLYPIGGETLTDTITIQWNTQTNDGNEEALFIYCFYTTDDITNWQRINNEALPNTGSFTWSTIVLPDGHYRLLIEAVDSTNAMGTDRSESFVIDNDKSNLSVTTIRVTNKQVDTEWVKNGDDIEIIAEIKDGMDLSRDDFRADLSVFSMGNKVVADSFDGTLAIWAIEDILCNPSEGELYITVTANGLTNRSVMLTADNTPPQMTIKKPVNGIYFFNKKLLPSESIFIIGSFTVQVQLQDNFAINRLEYYLNGLPYDTVISSPYQLYINHRFKGCYNLKLIAYDCAENNCIKMEEIAIFNPFGKTS